MRESLPRLVEVKALCGHRLALRYQDGVTGIVDLSHLVGRGVFGAWEAPGAFEQVHVGEYGQVSWSDDLDMCPDALYLEITGVDFADLSPSRHSTTPRA